MEFQLVGLAEEKEAIERAIRLNIPALLVGPTGCGKTTLVREVAKQVGKECIRVSLNGEVGITELVGKWLIEDKHTKWQDGPLLDAMRHGKWIVLDEINAALPEVLFCLNSVLDDARALTVAEKDGEVVVAHPDFRVFAAMNPSGEYVGTKDLNAALVSRFGIKIEFDYQKPKLELEIVKQTEVHEHMAKIVVDIGKFMRKLHTEHAIMHQVSTRDLITFARLLKDGAPMESALELTVLNKCEKTERQEAFDKIKAGLKLEINWKQSADTVLKNLSDDLVLSVEHLQRQKAQLEAVINNLKAHLDEIMKMDKVG